MPLIRLSILPAFLALIACGEPATTGGFDSPTPAARLHAISETAKSDDTLTLARIVEQLDSDDSAVRLMSITRLQRLTGETLGYHHYESRQNREMAVLKWVDAIESGRIQMLADHQAARLASGESDG